MLALKHLLFLAILASVLFFTNLGKPKLWDRDEPRNARCAVEMMERHDWTVPTFNGELRTHKPVLLYWLMMAAYQIFGVNEFAARFWSAALAIGTVLLTYSMGRRLLSPRAGFWAGIILSTTLMFNVAARAATPDSALMFFMTLGLALYVGATRWPQTQIDNAESHSDSARGLFRPSRIAVVAIYGAMGLAVLAKGPVGIVLPTAVMGLFLAIIRVREQTTEARPSQSQKWSVARRLLASLSPRHLLRTAWSMRPVTALASAMAVALPWYLLVGMETNGTWVQSFLMDHNIGRASSAMEGHAGNTLLYYPIAILVGFFPWSIFAIPVCLDIWHVLKSKASWSASYIFLLCWAGVIVAVFSVAQTKLPSYVTPAYPAIALITGACADRLITRTSEVGMRWLKAAALSLGVVGAIGIGGLAYATKVYLPGDALIAGVGVIPLVLGSVAFVYATQNRPQRFVGSVAIAGIGMTFVVFGLVSPRISERQQFTELLDATKHHPTPLDIASFVVHEPSWVFYAEREIPFLTADQEDDAVEFLSNGNSALITTRKQFRRVQNLLPSGTTELATTSYFLKNDELVLIGQPAIASSVDLDRKLSR